MGLADVKLHGAQTGFLRCADEFPAWKGELHGTQTGECREVWGTRFGNRRDYRVLKPERFVCIVLQIRRNCRALKLHIVLEDVVVGLMNKTNIAWFSNWLVAVNTGKIALEKSKIAWFSNARQ